MIKRIFYQVLNIKVLQSDSWQLKKNLENGFFRLQFQIFAWIKQTCLSRNFLIIIHYAAKKSIQEVLLDNGIKDSNYDSKKKLLKDLDPTLF